MTKNPVRIQIATYNILTAEAIVENYAEADKLFARYSVAKWRAGKSIGGAVICSASMSKSWNVKVGEKISEN